jgi:hypothetical protein
MEFEKNLKRILKVTPQTASTYMRNIRRLAKISGLNEIPRGKGWLAGKKGSALVKEVGKLPNSVGRHLYLAGNTAYRVYSDDKDRSTLWRSKTVESSNKYRDHRAKQKKSPNEEKNWATTKDLQKAATILKQKIKPLLKKDDLSNKEKYELQRYLIVKFYSTLALRLSPATLYLKTDSTKNTLLRPRGKRKFMITLKDHKTVKSRGEIKLEVPITLSRELSKLLPKLKQEHGYFLSNHAGGKLSKQALSKLLFRTFNNILGKKIGSRLIRVFKTTENKDKINQASALQNELGHSASMQVTYIRK